VEIERPVTFAAQPEVLNPDAASITPRDSIYPDRFWMTAECECLLRSLVESGTKAISAGRATEKEHSCIYFVSGE
jgi:hypothetical protein